jgi:hypothetical protein
VKLLVWDGSGLVLLWKRLESGAFRWPPVTDGVMRLSAAQLAALLDGLDWTRMHVPRLGARRSSIPTSWTWQSRTLSDFQLYNGMVTFRLDGTQRNIHLECGLLDYGPERASNQLTVIGDGKELFSRGYNAGEDAGMSDIDIKGVQALTFKLGGTTSGYFYCKDEIRY